MKVRDLIKILETHEPNANIFVSCQGYLETDDIRVVLTEKGIVIKDDCSIEELGGIY